MKKKPYKPKSYEQHPGQRIQIDVKVVFLRCISNPQLKLYQYTTIDEYSRYHVLNAYEEQSSFFLPPADFLTKVVTHFARKGIPVEFIQTDNGFEFINRFFNNKRDLEPLFQSTARHPCVHYKLIRPHTPRHNGQVERSHFKVQKRFYATRCSIPSLTLVGSCLLAKVAVTPVPCLLFIGLLPERPILPSPICLTNLQKNTIQPLPQ